MAKIKANMIGVIKCPEGKNREDFWLENAVNNLSNLRLGVRVSKTGSKKWMARYRVGGGHGATQTGAANQRYRKPTKRLERRREALVVEVQALGLVDAALEVQHEELAALVAGVVAVVVAAVVAAVAAVVVAVVRRRRRGRGLCLGPGCRCFPWVFVLPLGVCLCGGVPLKVALPGGGAK